jgi:hypothetical protein
MDFHQFDLFPDSLVAGNAVFLHLGQHAKAPSNGSKL